MSAVRAMSSISTEPSAPEADVQTMQDVLYDILAVGMDAEQNDVPSAAIERFLHEHAREPKSLAEFRGFFAEHGLSLRARPALQPPPLLLPPIERFEPVSETFAPPATSESVEPDWLTAAQPRRKLGPIAIWAASACAVLGLAVAMVHGYATITELRTNLERASALNQQDQAAIQALRDRASSLEASVASTREQMQVLDEKDALLAQALLNREHPRTSGAHTGTHRPALAR
jgi:hypothetical protein